MKKLTREDLLSLEAYAEQRQTFRANALAHKRTRQLALGDHATLFFEDRVTVQYQIQEMLRVERIFERAGIDEELESYNPLIPDGSNFKATMMLEFEDPDERQAALSKMRGIERKIWLKIGQADPVWAIADEDLERENETKTSAVHFLRFELPTEQREAMLGGAQVGFGIDHDAYRHDAFPIPEGLREALLADLSP
ncbi:MAG: DUF3501 family protein [Gammaproteobacteria bacterium]|nr:DUF3501 family protein [Gammaproteobacteria bacterium]